MSLPDLPLEITQHIFDYLQRELSAVLRLRRVNRAHLLLASRWRTFLHGWPKLKVEQLEKIYCHVLPHLDGLHVNECPYIVPSRCNIWYKLTSLHELSVGEVNAADIFALSGLNLQSLSIKVVQLTRNVANALLRLPNITRLSIGSLEVPSGEDITILTRLKSLRSFSCDEFNSANRAVLHLLPAFPKLHTFVVGHMLADVFKSEQRNVFEKMTQLHRLSISSLPPVVPFLWSYTHLLTYPKLQFLSIGFVEMFADTFPLLVVNAPALQELQLHHVTVRGSFSLFGALAELSKLSSISLSAMRAYYERDRFDTEVLTGIASLRHLQLSIVSSLSPTFTRLTQLRTLKILSSDVDDTDTQHLTNMQQLQTLEFFACSTLTADSWSSLTQLTSLTSLNLCACSGISTFSPISTLSGLCSLNISACQHASDTDVYAIARNLPYLRSINLSLCSDVSFECRNTVRGQRDWLQFVY